MAKVKVGFRAPEDMDADLDAKIAKAVENGAEVAEEDGMIFLRTPHPSGLIMQERVR